MNIVKIYSVLLTVLVAVYFQYAYLSAVEKVEVDSCKALYFPSNSSSSILEGKWLISTRIDNPKEIVTVKGTMTVDADGNFQRELTFKVYGENYLRSSPHEIREDDSYLIDVVRQMSTGSIYADTISYKIAPLHQFSNIMAVNNKFCRDNSLMNNDSTHDYCSDYYLLLNVIGSLELGPINRKICSLTNNEIIMRYVSTNYLNPVIISYRRLSMNE